MAHFKNWISPRIAMLRKTNCLRLWDILVAEENFWKYSAPLIVYEVLRGKKNKCFFLKFPFLCLKYAQIPNESSIQNKYFTSRLKCKDVPTTKLNAIAVRNLKKNRRID